MSLVQSVIFGVITAIAVHAIARAHGSRRAFWPDVGGIFAVWMLGGFLLE